MIVFGVCITAFLLFGWSAASQQVGNTINFETFVPYIVLSNQKLSETSFVLTVKPEKDPKKLPYLQEDGSWWDFLWAVQIKQPELQVLREYTPLPPVVGSETGAGLLRFFIRRVPDGEVSPYLSRLGEGDRVELRMAAPQYDFSYLDASVPERIRCIVGGTGLATALQIAHIVFKDQTRLHRHTRLEIISVLRNEKELFTMMKDHKAAAAADDDAEDNYENKAVYQLDKWDSLGSITSPPTCEGKALPNSFLARLRFRGNPVYGAAVGQGGASVGKDQYKLWFLFKSPEVAPRLCLDVDYPDGTPLGQVKVRPLPPPSEPLAAEVAESLADHRHRSLTSRPRRVHDARFDVALPPPLEASCRAGVPACRPGHSGEAAEKRRELLKVLPRQIHNPVFVSGNERFVDHFAGRVVVARQGKGVTYKWREGGVLGRDGRERGPADFVLGFV